MGSTHGSGKARAGRVRRKAGIFFPITIGSIRREAGEALRGISRGPRGKFLEVDIPSGFWGAPAPTMNVAVVLPNGVRVEGLGLAEAVSLARLLS